MDKAETGNFICESHGLGEFKEFDFEDGEIESVSCEPEKEIEVIIKVER